MKLLKSWHDFVGISNPDSDGIDSKLIRLYVNKYIIDEDAQSEIEAVIPLTKRVSNNSDAKEVSDQDVVIGQLEKLGFDYFIEKSYATHFILSGLSIGSSISIWIDKWFNDIWFNEFSVKHKLLDVNYRFVCTSLYNYTEEICTKNHAKIAYMRWRSPNWRYKLGSHAKSYIPIPIDIDIDSFEEAITTEQSPEPLDGWVNNFEDIRDTKEFFFYSSFTDLEIRRMSKKELNECRKLGLKPERDTIFRRVSGRRFSYIIIPSLAKKLFIEKLFI